MKFVLIRDGSGRLSDGWSDHRLRVGDLIILGAGNPISGAPDGVATASTIYADTDYVMDQVYWRHADLLPDRRAAEAMIVQTFGTDAIMVRLNATFAADFAASIDAIERAQRQHEFHRMQAGFADTLHLLEQLIPWAPAQSLGICADVTGTTAHPAMRQPLRLEVREVRHALHADLARRWRMDDLADVAHLSPRQLQRVFVRSLGVTPIAYLTVQRVKEMARLLRVTDLSVAQISLAVGWRGRTRARTAFMEIIGMLPDEYRRKAAGPDSDE